MGVSHDALMFAFTAALNRASRRYQWDAKRPTNVMTGTLYVSSLRYEWNVWSLFRRKAADVLRYYRSFPVITAQVEVFQHSAAALDCRPDRSIDFVFMDPALRCKHLLRGFLAVVGCLARTDGR